jgi:hypothetical protein
MQKGTFWGWVDEAKKQVEKGLTEEKERLKEEAAKKKRHTEVIGATASRVRSWADDE